MSSAEDHFSLWLTMAARDRPIRARIAPALGRAGYWQKFGKRQTFDGSRIGRGAGIGRVLASARAVHTPVRTVYADTRIIRFQGHRIAKSVGAHLRYLARADQPPDRRVNLYDRGDEPVDRAGFVRACMDDRHQFRTIVQADDSAEYESLRPLVRRLMAQVAHDLRTPLDWVAADHYDTATPHSHIVIRGADRDGNDLIIAPEYLMRGMRERASAIVSLDLGPSLNLEPHHQLQVGISREGPTEIDRDLVSLLQPDGRIFPSHSDLHLQAARMGRLRLLKSLGLAQPDDRGGWYLQPDLVERLSEIEWRNRMGRSRNMLEQDGAYDGPSADQHERGQPPRADPQSADDMAVAEQPFAHLPVNHDRILEQWETGRGHEMNWSQPRLPRLPQREPVMPGHDEI